MPTSTDNPQFKYLPITFFINAAKVRISEKNTKEKSLKTYNTKPAMKVNMGALRPMLPKLRIT